VLDLAVNDGRHPVSRVSVDVLPDVEY
jgi:hypothetical protein